MKKIGIQSPCTENWSKMTPTQKGAFCQKCAFEVHDFTSATAQEIKETLLELSGSRVCARMTVEQERDLRYDYSDWQNSHAHLRRTSLFVFIVVFGLTLFSCTTADQVKTIEQIQRSVMQLVKKQSPHRNEFILGEIEPIHDTIIDEPALLEDLMNESDPPMILGKVAPIEEDPATRNVEMEQRHFMEMKGDVALPNDFFQYVEDTVKDSNEKASGIRGKQMEVSVFPNPASTYTSVKFEVLKEASYSVSLIDQNGKTIKKVMYGKLIDGEHITDIDLTHVPSGVYFVRVSTKGTQIQEKLIKL